MSQRKKIYQKGCEDLRQEMEKQGFLWFSEKYEKKYAVDFSLKEQCLFTASALGEFHNCGKNALQPHMVLAQKTPFRYLERVETMLSHTKDSFLRERTEAAFLLLCDGTLDAFTKGLREHGEVSYGNMNAKGLMIKKEKVYFCNAEKMAEDLALLDLWKLLQKAMVAGKDYNVVFDCIDAYEKKRPLTKEEKKTLYGFLLLPYHSLKKGHKEEVSKAQKKWYRDLFLKGTEG